MTTCCCTATRAACTSTRPATASPTRPTAAPGSATSATRVRLDWVILHGASTVDGANATELNLLTYMRVSCCPKMGISLWLALRRQMLAPVG